MRCILRTVYGQKSAFTICTNCTDQIRTEKCLYDLYKLYGSDTNRKVPLRSVQTARIVKPYKTVSKIRRKNILSVLNEMQFTDRIRTKKCLYDLYKPYGSSNCISPSLRWDREYSKCPKWDAIYGLYTERKVPLRSLQTVRIVKPYKAVSQIRSVLNEMHFTDRIRTEKCLYDLYKLYGSDLVRCKGLRGDSEKFTLAAILDFLVTKFKFSRHLGFFPWLPPGFRWPIWGVVWPCVTSLSGIYFCSHTPEICLLTLAVIKILNFSSAFRNFVNVHSPTSF